MERRQGDGLFPPFARSAREARQLVARTLVGDLPDLFRETALVLTSELVTNAVRHGVGPVAVRVAWEDGEVRVEVDDHSPALPVARDVDGDALSGRGLQLVEALSSEWGVRPDGTGKTVWFTLRL
jgi:anti-sigma regulatory factor (Ser/Thr protein kinase)